MTMVGTIRNGQIVLSQGIALPDGAEVQVEIKEVKARLTEVGAVPSLAGLMRFAGVITDLPSDSSVNVDHYLYGVPKAD